MNNCFEEKMFPFVWKYLSYRNETKRGTWIQDYEAYQIIKGCARIASATWFYLLLFLVFIVLETALQGTQTSVKSIISLSHLVSPKCWDYMYELPCLSLICNGKLDFRKKQNVEVIIRLFFYFHWLPRILMILPTLIWLLDKRLIKIQTVHFHTFFYTDNKNVTGFLSVCLTQWKDG